MKAKSRKAQAAMEFMLFFAFFLMVFLVAMYYLGSYQASELRYREQIFAKEIANQFADEINLAVSLGDGYGRTFTFPEYIGAKTPYEIAIANGLVYLTWKDGEEEGLVISSINVKEVKEDAEFESNDRRLTIANIGGEIYVHAG
ncbi:MAG: hypothetical protein ABIH99_00345 [Candidatus Micrarchaeota archaeon]